MLNLLIFLDLIGDFVGEKLILMIDKNKIILKENIRGTHRMGAI